MRFIALLVALPG